MIFAGMSRDQLREMYRAAWRKFKQQHTLSPLDKQIVAVISEHPGVPRDRRVGRRRPR